MVKDSKKASCPCTSEVRDIFCPTHGELKIKSANMDNTDE